MKSILDKLKNRYKFYLFAYLIGYFSELAVTGIPNLLSLLPIKLFGFLFALLLGNGFYKITIEEKSFLTEGFRSRKMKSERY